MLVVGNPLDRWGDEAHAVTVMVIDSESAIKAEHQRQGLPYPGRDAGDNLDLLDAGDRNIIRRHLAAGRAPRRFPAHGVGKAIEDVAACPQRGDEIVSPRHRTRDRRPGSVKGPGLSQERLRADRKVMTEPSVCLPFRTEPIRGGWPSRFRAADPGDVPEARTLLPAAVDGPIDPGAIGSGRAQRSTSVPLSLRGPLVSR